MDEAPSWVDREVLNGSPKFNEAHVQRILAMIEVLHEWENYQQVYEIKLAILDARYEEARAMFQEFSEAEMSALMVAPTKGGIFTVHEKKAIRNEL